MNTDNEIRSFIKGFNPSLSDSKTFMENLEQRLDAVEDIKHIRKANLKNCWKGSITAFIAGTAIGMFVLFVVLFRPESLTQLRLLMEGVILRFLAFWQVFLVLAILFVALLVIIPIIKSGRDSTMIV